MASEKENRINTLKVFVKHATKEAKEIAEKVVVKLEAMGERPADVDVLLNLFRVRTENDLPLNKLEIELERVELRMHFGEKITMPDLVNVVNHDKLTSIIIKFYLLLIALNEVSKVVAICEDYIKTSGPDTDYDDHIGRSIMHIPQHDIFTILTRLEDSLSWSDTDWWSVLGYAYSEPAIPFKSKWDPSVGLKDPPIVSR